MVELGARNSDHCHYNIEECLVEQPLSGDLKGPDPANLSKGSKNLFSPHKP